MRDCDSIDLRQPLHHPGASVPLGALPDAKVSQLILTIIYVFYNHNHQIKLTYNHLHFYLKNCKANHKQTRHWRTIRLLHIYLKASPSRIFTIIVCSFYNLFQSQLMKIGSISSTPSNQTILPPTTPHSSRINNSQLSFEKIQKLKPISQVDELKKVATRNVRMLKRHTNSNLQAFCWLLL